MKIGIISDIHSNIEALKATIEFLKKENVDKIICLGDIIGIGPYPEKCIEYFMENTDCFLSCVKGNHEQYLINGIKKHNHKDSKPMSNELLLMHKHNHQRIKEQHLEYVKLLKDKDILLIHGKKILVEHYHTNDAGEYKQFYKQPTMKEILNIYEEDDADIYLFGHTHKSIYLENGKKYYINPGSLGCPMNGQCANCGILEMDEQYTNYKQIEVQYDTNRVIKDIIDLGYEETALIINNFYR